jgi:hypothetical protein
MIGLAGLWFIGMIVVVIFGRLYKLTGYHEELLAADTGS